MNEEKIISIKDVSEDSFASEVIEESSNRLVLADFWAPWCGPCKQLSPLLEEIANESKGKILLTKINIDENQQIAAQLRIQSIPTVFAFKDKKIVDAFQGVLPKNKILEFIEKNLGESIVEDFSSFFKDIDELMVKKEFDNAINLLEEFLTTNSDNPDAVNKYIICLTELKKYNDAENFIEAISPDLLKQDKVSSAITNLKMNMTQKDSSSVEELKQKYLKNSNDIETIINLSEKYFINKEYDNSFNLLLDVYLKFKDKKRQKIKDILIKYFNALGNDNEKTKFFRKKFSSIMFS